MRMNNPCILLFLKSLLVVSCDIMIVFIFTDEGNNWRDKYNPVKQVKMAEEIAKNKGVENNYTIYSVSAVLCEALYLYCKKFNRLDDLKVILNDTELIMPDDIGRIFDKYIEAFDILDYVKLDLEFGDDE